MQHLRLKAIIFEKLRGKVKILSSDNNLRCRKFATALKFLLVN